MSAQLSTLDQAAAYVAAGLSVIPIRADGSKAPASDVLPVLPDPRTGDKKATWRPFTEQRPTPAHLDRWFRSGRLGIAILSGGISGNREAIDFDSVEKFDQYRALAEAYGLTPLLKRCVLVRTPRPGYQLNYRCESAIEGNQKLAWELLDIPADSEIFQKGSGRAVRLFGDEYPVVKDEQGRDHALHCGIETRGEGGYTLAPGSPAACHPTGRRYATVHGDLCDPPVLTPAERASLLDLARALDEKPAETVVGLQARAQPHQRKEAASQAGLRPGDDYNLRGDVRTLLGVHRWQLVRGGKVEYWRRPGKNGHGWSATLREISGLLLFHVFSSNAAPFDEGSYAPFGVYALLEHNGDFAGAASALYKQGFGDRLQPPTADVDPDAETGRRIGRNNVTDDDIGPAAEPEQADKPVETPSLSVTQPPGEPPPGPPASLGRLPARVRDFVDVHPRFGIVFKRELSTRELEELGRLLWHFYGPTVAWCRWAIGDWYNQLPNVRGVRKARVTALFGSAMWQQIRNWARVAAAWPMEHRRVEITCWQFYVVTSRTWFTLEERIAYAERHAAAHGRTEDGKRRLRDLLMEEIAEESSRRNPKNNKPADLELTPPPASAPRRAKTEASDTERELFDSLAPATRLAFLQWAAEQGEGHVRQVIQQDTQAAEAVRSSRCVTAMRSHNDSSYTTPKEGEELQPAEESQSYESRFIVRLLEKYGPLVWSRIVEYSRNTAYKEEDLAFAAWELQQARTIAVDISSGADADSRVLRLAGVTAEAKR